MSRTHAKNNLDVLENFLYEVSTPGNKKYGQYLDSDGMLALARIRIHAYIHIYARTQSLTHTPRYPHVRRTHTPRYTHARRHAHTITRPPRPGLKEILDLEAAETAVRSYLHNHSCTIVSASKRGEYIRASAPIGTWNKLFDTKFYYYVNKDADKKTPAAVRAKSYTLDKDISDYVTHVLFTTQLPVKLAPRGHRFSKEDRADSLASNYITPEVRVGRQSIAAERIIYITDVNIGLFH